MLSLLCLKLHYKAPGVQHVIKLMKQDAKKDYTSLRVRAIIVNIFSHSFAVAHTHTHTHHTEATERLKCNDISLYRMLFCILIKYSHTSILYFILISSICICNKVIFYVLATILSL